MPTISDIISSAVVDHSRTVILVFMLLTAVFLFGATQISTDSGTSQFIDDIDSADALEEINAEFSSRSISTGTTSSQTQLIQERRNVLSKPALIEKQSFITEISNRDSFNIESSTSIAGQTARVINPNATTPTQKYNTLQNSTPSEIKTAVKTVLERQQFRDIVSDDYNPTSVQATSTISLVTHEMQGNSDQPVAGTADEVSVTDIQLQIAEFSQNRGTSITVFGSGIQSNELASVTGDSLILVIPLSILFILLFLTISYRDPVDITLGLITLLITVIWTFGFLGLVGIPFTQMLVAVPPLLLAVGIDFGIHSINRYREELEEGKEMKPAMKESNSQIFAAFGVVAGSTAIGFLSNLASPLGPLQDFGLVSAIGILFTFLTFGILLPSLKIEIDSLRNKYHIPLFSTKPLGAGDTNIGNILEKITQLNLNHPLKIFIILLLLTSGVGMYGSQVEGEFTEEAFLPPEEQPAYLSYIPLEIGPYETPKTLNFIDENFNSFTETNLLIYIENNLRQDNSLEKINRFTENPPDEVLLDENNKPRVNSILTVLQSSQSTEVQNIIEKTDTDNNGIPDRNLDAVYKTLEQEHPDQYNRFISESRGKTQLIISIDGSASNKEIEKAGRTLTESSRFTAISTGQAIIFKDVGDYLTESTLTGLVLSLLLTAIFLSASFYITHRNVIFGILNLIPVIFAIAFITGTMYKLGIPLNPLTATTLSISIGIGLDYAVHLTHRILDEITEKSINPAIITSVKGTGGALFGSALTTIFGIGSLSVAITAILADFGTIIGIGIFYSFIFSIILIPILFKLYDRVIGFKNTEQV